MRIVRSIQLPGAMDAMRAQRMGKIELERERQALTVQLTTNLAAYDLAPTDTCYLTLDRYGFASKLMEVRQRTWSPDGTLAYTVRETAAGMRSGVSTICSTAVTPVRSSSTKAMDASTNRAPTARSHSGCAGCGRRTDALDVSASAWVHLIGGRRRIS